MLVEQIKEKLKIIFKNRFNIIINDSHFDRNIPLGPAGLGLKSYYFLYLLQDIENEFSIRMSSGDLESGRIRTLNGLIDLIAENINIKVG